MPLVRILLSLLIFVRSVEGFSITNRGDLGLFVIEEEQPIGTVIKTVTTDQPADWFGLTDNSAGYFGINNKTGEISIQKRIDKEVVGDAYLTATVRARKDTFTKFTELRCTITDINDVVPSFLKRLYSVSISEKTSVNKVIFSEKAVDIDNGLNGQQHVTYNIVSGNEDGAFSITQYDGQVKVSRDLDYETRTQYTLNITAKDNPGLSNWTILEITVLDADDLPARFTAFSYMTEVSEDSLLGTIILQVVALDLDKDINGSVTYEIDQATNPSRLFVINNKTGVISLNGSLDREVVAEYSIRVLAYSSYPVTDHATVHIQVTDVNDNRPVFTKPVYHGTVVEHLAAGTSVLQVVATDNDKDINAKLRYHITPGVNSNQFSINHETGILTTATELDREEKGLYNLTVVVEDMNGNRTMGKVFNNTATVYVYVKDDNDNAPIFTSSSYNVTINESIAVGAEVIQIEAKDPDVDQDIAYYITNGNGLSRFMIGRRNGIVYTRSVIDRDSPHNETVFILEVMALDDKNHSLNSTATLTVLIDDTNDNHPRCSQDKYSASVYENATQGTAVMSLVCSDLDTKNNGRLTYQLVSGADEKFAVNSTSGIITVTNTLDYDKGNSSYKLTVLVADQGHPPLSRYVLLEIEVININDNNPVFKSDQYHFSILEGDYSSMNVLVGKVEATDVDSDSNGCLCGQIRYNIINSSGLFSVDHVTGELSTSNVFDRETKSIYTLIVMATDRDLWRPLSNITTVSIHVVDQNDNSPIFNQVNYTANVGEDKGPGYHVIKVESSDRDVGRNANITYSIISGNNGGVFHMDPMSGQIRVAAALDRETVNGYELTVAATDGGSSPRQTTVSVFIEVTDANDNTPVCLNSGMTVKIRENLPAGKMVIKISVVDKDDGINQKTYYSLVSDSFAVNPDTGDVNTTRSLDRENQSDYILTVMADNYNQSSTTVNCSVKVIVEDDNDNTPLFNTSSLTISVSESSAAGTTLLRVTASDEDDAHNSEIIYVLMGDGTKFAVNDTTGIITLISSLDREVTSHYTLNIVARDRGLPRSLSSMVQVYINVTDVNDNTPVFEQAFYSSSVPENVVNTLVMRVSAVDSDKGSNRQVEYFITGGNIGDPFSINSSGAIIAVTPLDREIKHQYELNITARDRGSPPLEATVKATITVLDLNDNSPNITNTPAHITIQENTATGSLVYMLTADDKDMGLNSKVTYTGYAEPAGTFAINPSTGMIMTVGSLDREITQRYTFHAYATDHGHPPLNSSIVSFDIFVSDVNDNNPVFDPLSYMVNVSEDVAIGTVILRVNASEKDVDKAGRIAFRIEAGDSKKSFSIDNTTGIIKNRETLDRESIAQFILVISAKDHGSPARYGLGYVTIHIEDTNDMTPVFLLNQYTSSIKENISVATLVATVTATDGDVGSNAKIVYSLMSGKGILDFNITTEELLDPESQATRFIGRIYSARDLDRESRPRYNLIVCATDGVHNSTAQVMIIVEDVNDNPPIFDDPSRVINISVVEDTPGGTKILNLTAKDNDEGSNARITYSISANDGKFYIDPNTGVMFTTPQNLDREVKDFYNLAITATDPGNNKASIIVNIKILDGNDNPPIFNSSLLSVTVNEGSADVMISVIATDKDQGANQELEYRIVSGNEDGIFQINNKTGNLTSVKILDRERPGLKLDQNGNGIYSLVVEAADHGLPQLSSKTNVIIIVRDINDNPPVFQQLSYSYEIPENISIGAIIGNVRADDQDHGTNGHMLYSIVSTGTVIPFAVNTSNGVLSANGSLEREVASSYEFTVKASDTGNPSLNGTATVKIVIKDINDNKPTFSQAEYHVTIPENTSGGSVVVKLGAQDSDEGTNGQVTYAILGGSRGHFIIEECTGIIRTFGYLDYESNQSYIINASASDRGRPSLRSSVLVFVNISDNNDHAPVFNQSQYNINISEDAPVNTSVLVVQATDLDQKENAQISYSLVDDFGVFDVHPSSGVLFIKKHLDREEKYSYRIKVKATDHGVGPLSSFAVVAVIVTDVNDNSPSFSKSSVNFQTSEDAFNGAFLGFVKAVDKDSGDNARLNYSINNRNDFFKIDHHTGSLSLVHSAMGLANQNISLPVTCRDNGRPSLSSNITVNVFISSGSRKAPELVPRQLNVNIYENTSIGETIATLNASDEDNSNIEYALLAGSHGKFHLNSTNGVLTLTGRLDRETKSFYMLFVMVKDRSIPPYSDYGSIAIDIRDINDNEPTFTQKPIVLPVPENTANGSKITQVTATDPDEGVNSEILYFLGGYASSTFSIDNKTGEIFTKTTLDYESAQSYNITVIAENTRSSVRLRSLLTFTINVKDVLDYKPTFPRDWLRTSIKEDAFIGSFVIDVNATLDDKINSYVFYRLIHNQSSSKSYQFVVEPESGIIRSQAQLDRERTSNYTLVVEARDIRGTNEFRSTVHVIIDVLDVNDNDPFFSQTSYTFDSKETSSSGDVIGQIQARDNDKGENAGILYEISEGNQNGYFGINSSDGRLFIKKPLDFESQSTYTLKVRAYDKQKASLVRAKREVSPPTYAEATVTVQVQDENDNPPVFTRQFYLGSFYPETSASTVLVTVKAIDRDSGKNSMVQYYSRNESLPGVLFINSLTGQVVHNKYVLRDTTTSYSVHVSARDHNGTAPYNTAGIPATVMVFYLTSSNAINLEIGVPLSFVNANRQQLESLLRNVTGQLVILKSLQKSPDDPLQTIAVIHLISNNSMAVLSRDEANSVFSDKSGELQTRYPEWQIRVISNSSTAAQRSAYFSFYIGAIMMFAVSIGIVGLIGLVVVCRYKQREKTFYESSIDEMALNRTDTSWYSIDIPGIGAYIESRAEYPGIRRRDMLRESKSNHRSTIEEIDGPVQQSTSSASSELTLEPMDEEPKEERTVISVLGFQDATRGSPIMTPVTERHSSSQNNQENMLNSSSESQPNTMEELEKHMSDGETQDLHQENCHTSTGPFFNHGYESEDTISSNQPSQGQNLDSNDLDNIALTSRIPFTIMGSKKYSPNSKINQDDLMEPRIHTSLNVKSPRKRSDSYSPADKTKNGKIFLKNDQARSENFPGRGSMSISGIYDIQKRMTQQSQKKRKSSSRVRFDLDENQHPDELEWERQVHSNRHMPGSLANAEDYWSDPNGPLGFFTPRRIRNESKTDDSPESSISDADECEVFNIEDVHTANIGYPPSHDEDMTTYVINPELKKHTEDIQVTQL